METKSKPLVFTIIVSVLLLGLGCPFKSNKDDLRPIGPNVAADLLIYFNSNLSQAQINAFSETVLSRPHPEGKGRHLPAGVRTFLRLSAVEGHEGIALTFFPNATREQREELMKSIKESPVVYKVLENTTPDSVKTLK